jgi:adenylate kinase
MKIFLIFGPPGSGKGTQATFISRQLGIKHISTGEILRRESERKSRLGRIIDNIMLRGMLVPDKLIIKIVEGIFDDARVRGFLLDGFPRDIRQTRALLSFLYGKNYRYIKVINLKVPDSHLVKRLLKRSRIEGRNDDNEETIQRRIRTYHTMTEPVLTYLKNKHIDIIDIDGSKSVSKVSAEIRSKALH